MAQMTITEALAEIKTIGKRITAKRAYVTQYLFRVESMKDPLEKEGGSAKAIKNEFQAITDLEKRIVELRRGIQVANEDTILEIEGVKQSIADWLVWRRDVAPVRSQFLNMLSNSLRNGRDQAKRQGSSLVSIGSTAEKPTDIIVNINEAELAAELEKLTNILGQLDGLLSLKNATIMID